MFGFLPVVSEWTNNLELNGPTAGNEDIWDSACLDCGVAIWVHCREMGDNELDQLRFTIWTNPRLKLLEWDRATVNCLNRFGDVVYQLLDC